MQQKFCSRGSGSSLLPERSGGGVSSTCVSSHNAVFSSTSITSSSRCCTSSSSSRLPFRCPRCGEQERFRSLTSLRAHLEYRHSYTSDAPPAPAPAPPPSGTFSITGQIHSSVVAMPWGELSLPTRRGQQSADTAGRGGGAERRGGGGGGGGGGGRGLHVRSLSDCRESGAGLHRASSSSFGSERRRTQSVGVGTQAEEEEDGEEEEEEEDEDEEGDEEDEEEERDEGRKERYDPSHHHRHHPHFGPPPSDPPPGPEQRPDRPPEVVGGHIMYPGLEAGPGSASAAVGRRLAQVLRCADTSMQRRLATVSTELAHTDTQLLCERAHSRHLAQERQEVAERERSLSRQVDVAVMVIAALREQLNASENELERREREVLTIQKFLEAAARQESCGKVRIQRFIENLLKRIALAERLLQYYQDTASPPPQYNHYSKQQPTDNRPHRTSKSRSAGGQLSSAGLRDNRSHSSSQFGGCPPFSKPPRDRDKENSEQRDREREQERSYRDRLAQSSRLFCRPEHRDDIWNPQHQRSAGYEA